MSNLSEHVTAKEAQMAEVLAKIVRDKRVWVEERKLAQPLESFVDGLTQSDRSFYQALTSEQAVFILECKKASPSKGLIREDFDLDKIAGVYKNYASAISVLTDEKYFQGQFDFLPKVRNQVTQPVLCKDFMVDSYQVYLARHYQADAVLLMLSVLTDDEYRELAETAHSLGMGVLTEVSNEEEVARAIALQAKVVGINNRNLRDLSTDLARTEQLSPLVRAGNPDAIVISESGIYQHQEVRRLRPHANGYLIGSSLMGQDDIELATRQVVVGDNKVCGLTHPDDAAKVYRSGAVYGGLIFVGSSKRHVDVEQARLTMSGAPLRYVGVFQNHTTRDVASVVEQLGLYAVQLHGQEDQRYVDELKARLNDDVEIWKAYGVNSNAIPTLLSKNVDRHLLDAQVGDQLGGTGTTFDWSIIDDPSKIILAGGLNQDNVKQAALLGCRGLDLNSGVETAPGKKDAEKLKHCFHALRDY